MARQQLDCVPIPSLQVLLIVDNKVSGPIANGVVALGEVPAGMQVHSLIPEVPEGGAHSLKCSSWSHLGPKGVSALCDPRVASDLGLATDQSDVKIILLIKDILGSRKYYRELYGAILLRALRGAEALQGGGCLIESSVAEWWHTFEGEGNGGQQMVDFVLQVGGCYRMVSNEQYRSDPGVGVGKLVDMLMADQAQNPHTWECPILGTGHVWESYRCGIKSMWEAWLRAATTLALTKFAEVLIPSFICSLSIGRFSTRCRLSLSLNHTHTLSNSNSPLINLWSGSSAVVMDRSPRLSRAHAHSPRHHTTLFGSPWRHFWFVPALHTQLCPLVCNVGPSQGFGPGIHSETMDTIRR